MVICDSTNLIATVKSQIDTSKMMVWRIWMVIDCPVMVELFIVHFIE